MSTTAVGNDDASGTEPGRTAGLKPHAVLIPVPELDRAQDFDGRGGWGLAVTSAGLVQVTPPELRTSAAAQLSPHRARRCDAARLGAPYRATPAGRTSCLAAGRTPRGWAIAPSRSPIRSRRRTGLRW